MSLLTGSGGTGASSGSGPQLRDLLTSTVRRRRLAPAAAAVSTNLRKQQLEQLQQLLSCSDCGSCWRQLYFVGPLWQVQLADSKDVEQLCRALSASLNQHTPHHTGSWKIIPTLISALIETSLDVTGPSTPTLLLSVTSGGGGGGGDAAVACQLLLCSDHESGRFLPPDEPDPCVWFPVVLARGQPATVTAVLELLRLVYGAAYTPIVFSQDQMRWMAAMWANGRDLQGAGLDGSATVRYQWQWQQLAAPAAAAVHQLPLNMRCDFSAPDIAAIWDSVHQESPYLQRHEMLSFHSCLTSLLRKDMGVDLTQMNLSSFQTPFIRLTSTGSVKFRSIEMVIRAIVLFRKFAGEFFCY